MTKVIGVRFRQAGKIYFFSPGKLEIKPQDRVIVETARGVEFGKVVTGPKEVEDDKITQPLKSVIRIANEEDYKKEEKNREKEKEAFNIKAEEAYRIGLVNAVYPQEELLAAAKKLANKIASNAPIAVRACKKAINEGLQVDMDQAIVVEEKAFGSCFETEDQKAGMGNFLEKDKSKKLKVVPFQNK